MPLTSLLKKYALSLGYARVGVTSAETFRKHLEVLNVGGTHAASTLRTLAIRLPEPPPNADAFREARCLPCSITRGQPFRTVCCAASAGFTSPLLQLAPSGALNGSRSALMRAFLEKHGCMAGDGIFLPKRWCASRSGITFSAGTTSPMRRAPVPSPPCFPSPSTRNSTITPHPASRHARRVALAASSPAPVRWGPSACIPAKASPSTHGAHRTASPIVPHLSEIAPSWRRAFTVAIYARRPAPATARNCGQRSLKLPCSSLSPVISACPRC